MSRLLGLVLAGGLLIGSAATAQAQVGISIGNPYAGRGIYIGAPSYGYGGYGYNSFGYNSGYSYGPGYGYSSGYSYAPGFSYSSGYAAPAYGYGYGYPRYGYGYGRGMGVFRPFRRW